jgi:hypothetical protein
MFCLSVKRILDISEASVLALIAHMKAIKINKIVGEDVEEHYDHHAPDLHKIATNLLLQIRELSHLNLLF